MLCLCWSKENVVINYISTVVDSSLKKLYMCIEIAVLKPPSMHQVRSAYLFRYERRPQVTTTNGLMLICRQLVVFGTTFFNPAIVANLI